MPSRSRWLSWHLRSCSAFTPTCLLPFPLTLRRHSSSAARRRPVSQPTNGTRTTSWTSSISTASATPSRWHPQQHHTLLVDEHGGLFGSSLLGKQVGVFRRQERFHPGRRERLSRR